MDEFDYIVVGSGSAGGTVAARLSEDPNLTVCVLEAGGRDWNPFIHIPAGFMKTLVDPSVNWLYEIEGSAGTAGRRIHAPRGKTMGGSSSINGNIYSRGQRLDFDGWAQARQSRLGVCRRLAVFQTLRTPHWRGRRDFPRPQRQFDHHGYRLSSSAGG